MTPAINLLKNLKLNYQIHEYQHDPHASSYGMEAAEKLAVTAAQVFKTLVVETDASKLAVVLLPVNQTLSFKKMAKALGCKKLQLADAKKVERTTGYVLGGVSPLGQKRVLPTIIDATAQNLATIYVSAGRRGLEIELSPLSLEQVLAAAFAAITDD